MGGVIFAVGYEYMQKFNFSTLKNWDIFLFCNMHIHACTHFQEAAAAASLNPTSTSLSSSPIEFNIKGTKTFTTKVWNIMSFMESVLSRWLMGTFVNLFLKYLTKLCPSCSYLSCQVLCWVGVAEAWTLGVCRQNAVICDAGEDWTLLGVVSLGFCSDTVPGIFLLLIQVHCPASPALLCAPENWLLCPALVDAIASGSQLGSAQGAPEPGGQEWGQDPFFCGVSQALALEGWSQLLSGSAVRQAFLSQVLVATFSSCPFSLGVWQSLAYRIPPCYWPRGLH